MHNNYHFLKRLVPSLSTRLEGMVMKTCFSQQKDELIIGFASPDDECYIKAYLDSQFCCLSFPGSFARAKKNSIDLFSELLERKVESIVMYANERAFGICCSDGFELLFKMHGNRANVMLYQNGTQLCIFKNKLQNDLGVKLTNLHRTIDQDASAYEKAEGDERKLFPTFGKLPLQELMKRGYEEDGNLIRRWNVLQDLLDEMETNPFYICRVDESIKLSLFPIGEVLSELADPMEAADTFFSTYIRENSFLKVKKEQLKEVEKTIIKSENYVRQNRKKLSELTDQLAYSKIGDLLMANLHTITSGQTSVQLVNFYDENKLLEIPLKRDLSPQLNAERYYRKGKNQQKEIDQLEANSAEKERQLEKLYAKLKELEQADSIKDLRKDSPKGKKVVKEELPFKQFEVDGYAVWVGKNAKNNDFLTLKHAKKEDLWLHAKDVSGSHVVIKSKSGKVISARTIEKAAVLAAYYSKRKTDSLCPVIVTPKKFVRKAKGALPGQVIVEKEKVVLVDPGDFEKLFKTSTK
ncbi:MAG: NFACT RNA binding domain-containing protein [Cyclobacteriaceae bacterium]